MSKETVVSAPIKRIDSLEVKGICNIIINGIHVTDDPTFLRLEDARIYRGSRYLVRVSPSGQNRSIGSFDMRQRIIEQDCGIGNESHRMISSVVTVFEF
jgi:hypothetical protein